MEKTKKGDFVSLQFTGTVHGEVFDTNIPEDLKKLSPDAKPKKFTTIIGEKLVVHGLDEALEGKDVGKEYEIDLTPENGFGKRNRELIKTIPLSVFTKQQINPQTGMTLMIDNQPVKVIAVSGARVITDFNNPLAGKEVHYKFIVKELIKGDEEKTKAFFEMFLGFSPEVEVADKITVKGPKEIESLMGMIKDKFKELIGKEMEFKPEEKKEAKNPEAKEDKKPETKEVKEPEAKTPDKETTSQAK